MHKYSVPIDDPANTVQTNAQSIRIKFKNAREVSVHLRKKTLPAALLFLKNVISKKECVVITRYGKKCGRTAQTKKYVLRRGQKTVDGEKNLFRQNTARGRWPAKPCQAFVGLLRSMVTEAEKKGIEPGDLVIQHVQVNKAPQVYGRMHRAFGRVSAYNTKPCHVEIVAVKKPLVVADAD